MAAQLEGAHINRRWLLALALMLASLGSPAMAAAGTTCSSTGGHQITLSNGGVAPATGTTATTFTFSATLQDNLVRTRSVHLVISGLGTFAMTGTGTDYMAGVPYAVATLAMPRRRKRTASAPVVAMAASSAPVVTAPAAPAPAKRAPALANVPSLDDESFAEWFRPSPDDPPGSRLSRSGPGSDAMKRRTQPRPRTTRDLRAGG